MAALGFSGMGRRSAQIRLLLRYAESFTFSLLILNLFQAFSSLNDGVETEKNIDIKKTDSNNVGKDFGPTHHVFFTLEDAQNAELDDGTENQMKISIKETK